MRKATSLTVDGDFTFGAHIQVVGDVELRPTRRTDPRRHRPHGRLRVVTDPEPCSVEEHLERVLSGVRRWRRRRSPARRARAGLRRGRRRDHVAAQLRQLRHGRLRRRHADVATRQRRATGAAAGRGRDRRRPGRAAHPGTRHRRQDHDRRPGARAAPTRSSPTSGPTAARQRSAIDQAPEPGQHVRPPATTSPRATCCRGRHGARPAAHRAARLGGPADGPGPAAAAGGDPLHRLRAARPRRGARRRLDLRRQLLHARGRRAPGRRLPIASASSATSRAVPRDAARQLARADLVVTSAASPRATTTS